LASVTNADVYATEFTIKASITGDSTVGNFKEQRVALRIWPDCSTATVVLDDTHANYLTSFTFKPEMTHLNNDVS